MRWCRRCLTLVSAIANARLDDSGSVRLFRSLPLDSAFDVPSVVVRVLRPQNEMNCMLLQVRDKGEHLCDRVVRTTRL